MGRHGREKTKEPAQLLPLSVGRGAPARPKMLYYGDNLGILRKHLGDETIDLVYLDPPFNSGRDYNIVHGADAQKHAFKDTWEWNEAASAAFDEVLKTGRPVALALESVAKLVPGSSVLAYMSMMAIRLIELHRVMKPTASLYLHCDPTASHYLRVVLDAIFGVRNFRNEIIWQRFSGKNDPTRYGRGHDVLFFYTKSDRYTWHPQFSSIPDATIVKNYTAVEPGTGRRYRLSDLTANKAGGDTDYEWHGMRPYRGRHWAYSRENMDRFLAEGRIVFRRTGMPVYKRYLDEMPGVPLQDVWTDIRLAAASKERVGYQTQKPVALLERIIASSSNPGDLILDPFCGCGSTVQAAQRLKRNWVGIDITNDAINLIKQRLDKEFGQLVRKQYLVDGEPFDHASVRQLARDDPHRFERWAVGELGDQNEAKKKGADGGIDGVVTFRDGSTPNAPLRRIVMSVKSGQRKLTDVRELRGVVDREKAAIGVLIIVDEPTKQMKAEAASAGFFTSSRTGDTFPRLQILTGADIVDGFRIKAPVGVPQKPPVRPPTVQREFFFLHAGEK